MPSRFGLLKTDCLDLVYYHNVGSHDVPKAMESDGVFSWLVKQKKAGKFRFLGISGHNKPGDYAQLLETDEVDVLLTLVNFVDLHTYGFEEKVLPIARERNIGIMAMKVFGGAKKSAGSYGNAKAPPELDVEHLELAVRYAMSVPGVNTLNLGVHNMEQVRQNIEMVRNCGPLTADDRNKIAVLGKELSPKWGPAFRASCVGLISGIGRTSSLCENVIVSPGLRVTALRGHFQFEVRSDRSGTRRAR